MRTWQTAGCKEDNTKAEKECKKNGERMQGVDARNAMNTKQGKQHLKKTFCFASDAGSGSPFSLFYVQVVKQ